VFIALFKGYKHVVITHPGGPDVLKMVEDELREPKAGEVWVKILATGVALTNTDPDL
jgi:NADPH:quinone reductase-like Zn-dependent oxidoreductase